VIRVPQVPAVEVALEAVEVDLSLGLRVQAIAAHGGRLTVHGEPAEVERQLSAWRSATNDKSPTSASRPATAVAVDGLSVQWRMPKTTAELWGARFRRDASGKEQLGADLGRFAWQGGQLDLAGASLSLRREADRRVLERLTTEAVSATVDMDSGQLGEMLGSHADAARQAKDSRLPEPRAPDPAAAERGPKLRRTFARLAGVIEAGLPSGSELDLSGVTVKVRRGAESLNVGPGRLRMARGAERIEVAFVPGVEAKDALSLRLELPLAKGGIVAEIDGGPVSLAALGVKEGDFGLSDLGKTQLEAKGRMTLAPDGTSLGFSGSGKVRDLSIEHAALASRPVRGIVLGWRGKGELALDGSRLRIDDGEIELGNVRVHAAGELERGPDHTRASFTGGVPLASCQAMLDSVPDGLMPLLSGMRMSGTFALEGKLDFDTRKLAQMRTDWKLANECRVTATPADVAPRRFKTPWVRNVVGADGRLVQLESGPGTAGWVSFGAISPHMETAVLICEDGAFRRHRGFHDEAIQNSIRENIRAGRFLRGASTISMQLAKNLYLEREKTLSRKLQEAVLTLLLEQELSKDEILELYLNVIEFGPGIYGVGRAAPYYFNTSAGQLSLGQALYLASILPNPKQSHFGADGHVTPGWSNYLRKLMHIAVKIRRITDEELEDAIREQVTFGVPYSPRAAEPEPSGEIDPASLGQPVEETSFAP
jgi:hypothetical protein